MAATRSSDASPRARHLPGEEGIWVLIGGDLMVFALFFGTFLFYRKPQADLFVHAQHALNQTIGIANTLLMLTSSWFVARAVQDVRDGRCDRAAPQIILALVCALGFLVDKVIEWSALIGEGHTLLSNDFYMFFFMFTGIHALHVLIGIGVLIFMHRRIRASVGGPAPGMVALESGAGFWHLVDLLWIILFALLYLIR